jgi:hypothetical protein
LIKIIFLFYIIILILTVGPCKTEKAELEDANNKIELLEKEICPGKGIWSVPSKEDLFNEKLTLS